MVAYQARRPTDQGHLMPGLLASSIMPRTTLDLDVSVLRELRRRGASERKSMGRVASELLARLLGGPDDRGSEPPFRWISRDLGSPRVDLEDKEALQAFLDGRA